MRFFLILLSTAGSMALSGCADWRGGIGDSADDPSSIRPAVRVTTLPAGSDAGRHEATVDAVAGKSYLAHWMALMDAAGQRCAGTTRGVVPGKAKLPSGEGHPPAGETLSLVVTCPHERLPNHRVVEQGKTLDAFAEPVPEGLSQDLGSVPLKRHHDSVKFASEALIGGFVRKAYTEECAGKAVVVEFLSIASEAPPPIGAQERDASVAATMHYRCLESRPPEVASDTD